jgi:hypothetical protein
MAEFKLGRIKFVYQGAWNDLAPYVVDDVVSIGGKTYICITSHTSSAIFSSDYDVNPELSKWSLVADGSEWLGDWTAEYDYNAGALVLWGGIVYICKEAHTSATYDSPDYLGLEEDQEKWDAFASSFSWKNTWTTVTRYKVRDIVRYGGYTYICNTKHISSEFIETDITSGYWDTFNAGINYLGTWSGSEVRYKLNDVVKFGPDLWICTTVHSSTGTTIDTSKFEIFVNGFQFEDSWTDGTVYQIGDIVAYGGYTYICILNHTTTQVPATATSYWRVFTTGFNFQGDWISGGPGGTGGWEIGHVVRLGGYTYVATANSTTQKPPNTSYWQRLNSGIRWNATVGNYTDISSTNIASDTGDGLATFDVVSSGTTYTVTVHSGSGGTGYANGDTLKILGTDVGGISPANDITVTVTGQSSGVISTVSNTGISVSWATGTTYVLGDVVLWGVSSYICVDAHIASSLNRPDADSTGLYWNVLAGGTEQAVMTTQGDMFIFGNNGPERLPIGNEGQILRVTNNLPTWSYYGQVNNVVYVTPYGEDTTAAGSGLTIDKPWKTVRFACEQIENGYLNTDARDLLRKNKQFLIKEVYNYITYTFQADVTGTSAGAFLTSSTAGLTVGMPINFTSQTGSLLISSNPFTSDDVYYVKSITTDTSFTIALTPTGSAVPASGTGTGTVNYYSSLLSEIERDAGYIVEGVIYDISHGGTLKTYTNIRAYYDASGTSYINTAVEEQIAQFVAAHTWLLELINNVLSNTAPSTSYQTLNSVSPQAEQIIDTSLLPSAHAITLASNLMSIVINGLELGSAELLATPIQPNTTVSVKTGTYNEVLPIVIPNNTAIVGDELRSTVIQPKAAIPELATDSTKTISALNRIKAIIPDLIANNNITETVGNTQTQVTSLPAGSSGSTSATAAVEAGADIMYDLVDNGLGGTPSFVFTAPTGYNTTFLNGYGNGKAQIVANYNYIKAEISAYLALGYSSLWSSLGAEGQANCQRDIGYILDALQHDMTYGGNVQTLIAGSSYYSNFVSTIAAGERTAILDAYGRLKTVIGQIVLETNVTETSGNVATQDISGTPGSAGAATFAEDRIQDIIDWITDGAAPASLYPTEAIALSSSGLQAAYTALQAKRTEIQADTVAWVKKFYHDVNFNATLCSRDAGLIVDALSYDTVLGTNFNSITSGRSYNRAISSVTVVMTAQKEAELGAINFIKYKAGLIAASGAAAQASAIIDNITAYITGTTLPEVHGTITYDHTLETAQGAEILRANKTYLAYEATAWITASYGGVVTTTTASTNLFTLGANHNFEAGDPVVFSGTTYSGSSISTGTTYYVLASGLTSTEFKISAELNGTAVDIATDGSGSTLIVSYSFDATSCRRDMIAYVDALVYDLQWTGNYRSLRAAELYVNAVQGSELSDMFQVSNGSGLRNCTLSGLTGTLTAVNQYGTKRPTAGAFVALNPGFGPNDSNVWVSTRSHYSQNVTMFGTGCTGAKIDSALHSGGNKSMVKNDFTTIISDGIGVWCTGSGSLTELVSVFNYYGYAGYLAELGGRIRATNGNSSYGTYGVIAEGSDTFETPIYATLDNRANDAFISNVPTDGTNEILRFEYNNAGQGYTNSVATISGSGYNAAAVHDEFRDSAVFQTRIVDLNDGNVEGGTSYITAANVAQEGNATQITIAATDTALSNSYNGMRVQLVAGTGVGQYANILTFVNGTKIAQVYSDSFGNITITGSTTTVLQASISDVAKLYVDMPLFFTATTAGILTANTVYYVAAIPSTTTFTVKSTTGGSAITGLTATSGQTITTYKAGWDHAIPGTAIAVALDLTTSYIIEPRISYSSPGYKETARTIGSTSATWQAVTYGASKYVAVASGGTTTAFSNDGTTWATAGALPASATWNDVIYTGGEDARGTAVIGGLGGSGAILEAVLGSGATAGQVVSVTVVSGGYNYTTSPVITFSGGGGAGTTATALILDGAIKEVILDINGSGYTTAPTVTAVSSKLTGITVNAWGKNYFSTPTVAISAPFSATAWSSGGSATSGTYYSYLGNFYRATSNGTFTTTGPSHTSGSTTNGTVTLLYVGTQATATANITNYGVSSYTISESGYGYSTTPTVTVTDTSAKYVAIRSGASATSAYQTAAGLGTSWTAGNTLQKTDLASITYGAGLYVAVGGTSGTASAVSSTDGITWIDRSSVVTALGAGSYSSIVYGNGTFIAIQTGGIQTTYTTNGVTWTAGGNLPNLGSNNWTSLAYGNGRFVAIQGGGSASTYVAYSIDKGVTWTQAPAGLGSSETWQKVSYGQGLFFAVASGSQVCATSPDGINWTVRTTGMPSSSNWKSIVLGNISNNPLWVAVSSTSGTVGASIVTGAQTLGRVKVVSNTVTEVRMIEPGSSYPKGTVTATTGSSTDTITVSDTTNLVNLQPVEFTGCTTGGLLDNVTYYIVTGSIVANTSFKIATTAALAAVGTAKDLTTATGLSGTYRASPITVVTDPNKVIGVTLRTRHGDGVLGNPSFSNRGANNSTATASTTGDGYADLYQNTSFINVANLYSIPTAGANVQFASITGTSQWYKLVSVTNQLGSAGNYTAQFQINPALTTRLAPTHGDVITTRLAYSQVRLTGHDFLYIGTGGKEATNYPYVDPTNAIQANQQNSSGGGRVFFTSTDQDGNFNVGNLFGVQQATGTATLNASAFNLSGLQSLQLGAVSLGVGSAIITQFSTDPYFTANSDNIVPTQKAIKSFITAQIGGGQSALNVNTLTAGQIYIAGNSISNTTGAAINVTSKMNFIGGIDGTPVAWAYFGQR